MAMYTGQEQFEGRRGEMGRQLLRSTTEQRQMTEKLAWHLSQQAMQQTKKAIEGLVALPTALAVGCAASALYAVAFLARGFEVFEQIGMEVAEARQGEEYRGIGTSDAAQRTTRQGRDAMAERTAERTGGTREEKPRA